MLSLHLWGCALRLYFSIIFYSVLSKSNLGQRLQRYFSPFL
jgi:hypothetical protein